MSQPLPTGYFEKLFTRTTTRKKIYYEYQMIMNMDSSKNVIENIQLKVKKKPKTIHFVLIKQKQILIFSQIIWIV